VQPQTPAARIPPRVPRPPPDPAPTPDDRPGQQPRSPSLSVAAVARKLGIAPATLRTWDRRYGIGPAEHTSGTHRRYNADDLARLDLMRHALLHGATPAAAAHYALTALPARPDTTPAPADAAAPEATTPPPPGAATARNTPNVTRIRADNHGLSLPLVHAGWQARGLIRAATTLDTPTVHRLLNESIAALGAQITWDVVARPVLRALAQRWVDTGEVIEIEHLFSECVAAVFGTAFSALIASTPAPTGTQPATTRPVLLAGVAGDQHVLPLVVLSVTLAQRGVACRSLGTDLPVDALVTAIRRTAPIAVLLWSQLPDTADPALLKSLPRIRPGFHTFVAGPGWAEIVFRPPIGRLNSLREATDVLSTLATA
jgi:MerR family transcriptional regulator, light-induced transcriptional regulator